MMTYMVLATVTACLIWGAVLGLAAGGIRAGHHGMRPFNLALVTAISSTWMPVAWLLGHRDVPALAGWISTAATITGGYAMCAEQFRRACGFPWWRLLRRRGHRC